MITNGSRIAIFVGAGGMAPQRCWSQTVAFEHTRMISRATKSETEISRFITNCLLYVVGIPTVEALAAGL